MSIEAIKALRTAQNNLAPSRGAAITYGDGELWDEYEQAIKSLEQAQPSRSDIKQEPVAVVVQVQHPAAVALKLKADIPVGTSLYTSPPAERSSRTLATQRQWVGLTDVEAEELWELTGDYLSFFEAIEAKLKEKNTRNGDCL